MKILIACEFSGIVREAFFKMGHDAVSCDLLPSEDDGVHFQGDVMEMIDDIRFDLMIAHPPCTHLAVSGARWFKDKQKEQKEAIKFFMDLINAPIPKICVENPDKYNVNKIQKARSDNTTLDVWAWRNQINMFMVKRSSKTETNKHCRRKRGSCLERIART